MRCYRRRCSSMMSRVLYAVVTCLYARACPSHSVYQFVVFARLVRTLTDLQPRGIIARARARVPSINSDSTRLRIHTFVVCSARPLRAPQGADRGDFSGGRTAVSVLRINRDRLRGRGDAAQGQVSPLRHLKEERTSAIDQSAFYVLFFRCFFR